MNKDFAPTWLYIKQHNRTGLKYFGMTRNKDPVKYPGSGKYWKLHLKKHGNDVSTPWAQLFENNECLIQYAEKFSKDNNIVDSQEWANLKPEFGIDGGGLGRPKGCKVPTPSRETVAKRVAANKGKQRSAEFCQQNGIPHKGKHTAKNSATGEILGKVSVDDPRWDTGEIVSFSKGVLRGAQSDERRANTSKALKGKSKGPQQLVTCPHCNKKGGVSNMSRYHFENCKNKVGESQ